MVNLVLIPPMGHGPDFYDAMIEHLEKKFNIHNMSYPENIDFGSDPLETLAKYFSKKIDNINGPIILVGLSLGATLSFRIKALTKSDIIHIFAMATGGKQVARARKEMINYALKNMSSKDFISKSLGLDNQQFLEHFSQNKEQALNYLHALKDEWNLRFQENKTNSFIELIKAAIEVNFEKEMTLFQMQTTVIWGEKDKVFSMRHLKGIQKLMPHAKYEVLPDSGHYLPLENPKEVAKIVLDHEISFI